MSKYTGPERRKLKNLRQLIDKTQPPRKQVMIKMARMLGPDKLGEMDGKLGEMNNILDGMVKEKPKSKPRKDISEMTIDELSLPTRAKNQLRRTKIRTVSDLVTGHLSQLPVVRVEGIILPCI